MATLGFGGLMTAFWYARVIQFPGMATLVGSVCTAMLIVGNASGLSLVGRVLSLRPVVLTGLISYSLYLWHVPILAFFSYYSIHDLTGLQRGLALFLVYLVALGSWAAIEQPFRSKALARSSPVFVSLAVGTAVVLAAFGYWLIRSDGLPQRWAPQVLTPAVSGPYYPSIDASCFHVPYRRIAAGNLCSFGPRTDSATKVVVWGDSHAFALLLEYQSLAIADNIRIYFGVQGACWPLVGSEVASAGTFWHVECAKFNAAMVKAIQRLKPQRIILNAYWLDPGAAAESEFQRRSAQTGSDVMSGIRRTLDSVQAPGRSVCAVLTVPGYTYPIPYALAMAKRRHLGADTLLITREAAFGQYQAVESNLRTMAHQNLLRVTDPKEALCPASTCLIRAADGTLLYRDSTHMSVAGSHFLSGVLEHCLADLH